MSTARSGVSRMILTLIVAARTAGVAIAHAQDAPPDAAQPSWSHSPHGKMLERILPPSTTPGELPAPQSAGARLTARYCVQCHHLPNPHMHAAARWKVVVDRMVWRMQGRGNLGTLMSEMMAGVRAPAPDEVEVLTEYLMQNGQREIDPQHPALAGETGRMFSIACSQCHELPDPQRHTAHEWRAVVERMRKYMAWSNRVVGEPSLRTIPELDTEKIVALLERYARAEKR